jgi:hypothetical protein
MRAGKKILENLHSSFFHPPASSSCLCHPFARAICDLLQFYCDRLTNFSPTREYFFSQLIFLTLACRCNETLQLSKVFMENSGIELLENDKREGGWMSHKNIFYVVSYHQRLHVNAQIT